MEALSETRGCFFFLHPGEGGVVIGADGVMSFKDQYTFGSQEGDGTNRLLDNNSLWITEHSKR